mmetsp:Transcript_6107/g.10549  ORF Transcript_6107/g.10549 Transcript_6107/m.10549 type:complete len:297 (+) Transcript_6107:104-994(+)
MTKNTQPQNTNTNKMEAGNATALFATITYAYSVASLVSFWFFLVPNQYLPLSVAQFKPYSMELATKASSMSEAAFYNIGSMFVFGFLHSLLARKTVKQWMGLPSSVERSFFCLQGAFFLHMMQHYWKEVGEDWTVWTVSRFPLISNVILATYWFGAAFLLSATFALDHFHLFGLSQGFGFDINKLLGLAATIKKTSGISTRWHYRLVAHPIMTGFFLNVWATPIMTPSRLLLALFLSSYITVAVIRFEESSLRAELGTDYDKYLASTPRFLPATGLRFRVNISSSNAVMKGATKDK